MDVTLLVLAAGMGSRYGGLKQLDPVGPNGETILEYSIFDAIRAGFTKVVFVIRRDFEDLFREQVVSKFEDRVKVECVFQELDKLPEGFAAPEGREKPWGTGHAIMMAQDVIDGPFAAINADDFYGESGYRKLVEYFKADTGDVFKCCMVGFVLRNTLSDHGTVSRGVCRCNGVGCLEDVEELTDIKAVGDGVSAMRESGEAVTLTGAEHVSMNMWGFGPEIFAHLNSQFCEFLSERGNEMKSEFYIPTVVNRLVKERVVDVHVLESEDAWFGVTYQEDKPIVIEKVRALVDSGRYPEQLT